MDEKKGIKELKEFLNAMEVLARTAGMVMKDGKIDLADLALLVPLFTQMGALMEGFKGLDKALGEMKDLEESEVVELVKEGFEAFRAFKEGKSI